LDAFSGLRYTIPEPLARLAAAQREKLAGFPAQLEQVAGPDGLDPRPAYLIGNEVLDALPFHVVESDGTGWRELGVAREGEDGFRWCELGSAAAITAGLPVRAAGYRTEVRPDFAGFLAPWRQACPAGRMLWIDYGFERDDYYAEPRTRGTLRTFGRHRAGEDPLIAPGTLDITAHVDFTALGEALGSLGGRVTRFENQSRFLTSVARPWLLSLEGRIDGEATKLLRNFQTLTHPGHLGSRFHLMEAEFDG
jgi:SAM-dependent MidA family methyltransferase